MRIVAILLTAAAALRVADVNTAVAQLRSGNFAGAEITLRGLLVRSPSDTAVLSLLAADMDEQGRWQDADAFFRKALAQRPQSPSLLNNYGNHLLAAAEFDEARSIFRAVVARDRRHENANLQLAKLAMEHPYGPAGKQAQYALDCLSKVAPGPDSEALRTEAHYALGLADAESREYQRAEAEFSKVLENNPAHFGALYNLGLAALRAGRPDRARDVLEVALKQRPNDADTLAQLGFLEHEAHRDGNAVGYLAKAATLNPYSAALQRMLAESTFAMSDYEHSFQAWGRYVSLRPDDYIGRRQQAFAQAFAGDRGRASATLTSITAAHPDDAVAHWELGLALTRSDRDAADHELTRAISLNTHFAGALYARGVLRGQMDQTEAGLHDLLEASQLNKSAAVFDQIGKLYLKLNRTENAITALQNAVELDPANRKALLHLGQALKRASRDVEADAIFTLYRGLAKISAESETGVNELLFDSHESHTETTLRAAAALAEKRRYLDAIVLLNTSKPQNREIFLTKAILLEVSGKQQDAEDLLQEARKQWPESADVHAISGILLETRKRAGEAQKELEAAIATGSENPAVYYYLAEARLQLQPSDLASANEPALKAVAMEPSDPWAHALVGKIYFEQHRFDDALRELNNAVRIQPSLVSAHYMLARVYAALGKTEQQKAEADEVRRLRNDPRSQNDERSLVTLSTNF